MNTLIKLVFALVLIAGAGLAIREHDTVQTQLELKTIQVEDKSQQLDELRDTLEVLNGESVKDEKQIKELENQKQELEKQLQAKLEAKRLAAAEAARIAENAKQLERTVTQTKTASAAPSNPTGNKAIARDMAAARGWGGDQWNCLHSLWVKESGFNHLAQNPSSGAYGIPQSLPGSKMATVAGDWRTNPRTQIQWGLNYIAGRYGTPCSAWNHSQAVNWY